MKPTSIARRALLACWLMAEGYAEGVHLFEALHSKRLS